MPTRNVVTGPATEMELIEREIRATIEAEEEHLRIIIANAVQGCESPIERVIMAALVAKNYGDLAGDKAIIYSRGRTYAECRPAFDGLHIWAQVACDGYRLDFLAMDVFDGVIQRHTVIEVDGHDYHERTRRQASHDKRRDRHFTKKGWQVLRYTGSDVWRAPSECAWEILQTARGLGEEV